MRFLSVSCKNAIFSHLLLVCLLLPHPTDPSTSQSVDEEGKPLSKNEIKRKLKAARVEREREEKKAAKVQVLPPPPFPCPTLLNLFPEHKSSPP